MTTIEATVVIDRPVEEVWRFITEFPNYPKWHHGLLEMKQTSEGPPLVGTMLQARRPNLISAVQVTEYEPNRKFGAEYTPGPMKGTALHYNIEAVEGRTRLTETAEFRFGGFFKLVGPLVSGFPGKVKLRPESRMQSVYSNPKLIHRPYPGKMASSLHSHMHLDPDALAPSSR